MKRSLIVFILIALPFLNGCSSVQGQSVSGSSPIAPITMTLLSSPFVQSKACAHGLGIGYVVSCQFDNPVKPGDLIVAVGVGGCSSVLNTCNTVSDSQTNAWKVAIVVPNYNGIPLWYALNAKGGVNTVYFDSGTEWMAIIAEYGPSTGFEDANHGEYGPQNLHPNGRLGSSDIGYTMPVETTESCELLISWGLVGSYYPNQVQGSVQTTQTAGPGFTMRGSDYGALAFEDATTGIPGLYIGTMSWSDYNHWDLGVAAFKMGGCK
jgi:hypothetical protein